MNNIIEFVKKNKVFIIFILLIFISYCNKNNLENFSIPKVGSNNRCIQTSEKGGKECDDDDCTNGLFTKCNVNKICDYDNQVTIRGLGNYGGYEEKIDYTKEDALFAPCTEQCKLEGKSDVNFVKYLGGYKVDCLKNEDCINQGKGQICWFNMCINEKYRNGILCNNNDHCESNYCEPGYKGYPCGGLCADRVNKCTQDSGTKCPNGDVDCIDNGLLTKCNKNEFCDYNNAQTNICDKDENKDNQWCKEVTPKYGDLTAPCKST